SALWPLIRLVRVRAKSQALSGGAVLVDLPGVADANLARSSIAKEYMKRCDCIWIAAPITRAVDDKTAKDLLGEAFRTQLMMGKLDASHPRARWAVANAPAYDGNYDASFITFIATKTDDLSCTEVIGALGLEDNPELVEIEAKLDVEQAELEDWTVKAKAATEETRETVAEIKQLEPILADSQNAWRRVTEETQEGISGGRKAKRARVDSDDDFAEDNSMDLDDDDDFIDDHDEIEEANTTDAEDALVEEVLDQDIIEIDSDSDEITPKATPVPNIQERVKKSIQETEARIQELRKRTEELKKTRTEAESKANSHKKAASKFQKEKNAFCSKKRNEMEGVNVPDRQVLAKLWESTVHMVQVDDSLGLTQAQPNPPPAPPAPPVSAYMRRGYRRNMSFQPPPDTSLNGTAGRAKRILAQTRYALPPDGKGISFRLRRNMKNVAANCVEQLKKAFRDGIEERCHSGAIKARQSAVEISDNFASSSAVEISDNFASSMHWQSYRAALRRNGEWKGDLNADLVGPMTREIAASWARVFDSDLFAPTVRAERQEITDLLKEVQVSAPPGLGARCEVQSQLALKEAEVLTTNLLRNLKTLMADEQKDISRCLTPQVQRELLTAYQSAAAERGTAAAERGTGSVARQKKLFHDYVETSRGTIFSKGTETLFSKLDQAAELIGVLLELGLSELAEKIEVNMSVLWDIPKASNTEAQKRRHLIQQTDDMLHQLELWLAASKASGATDGGTGEPTAGYTFPGGTYATGTDADERMDEDEDEDEDEEEDENEGDEDEDEDEDELGDEDGDGESDEDGPYYGMYY
ncbi:hypothetical protein RSAG8_07249, partial [Rhizoctonia solani AG-8 WAC10335]